VSALGNYFFDWNQTRTYHSTWPPRAKFHKAQTISKDTAVGVAGLCTLWGRRSPRTQECLQVSAAAASFY